MTVQDEYSALRDQMVEQQVRARGIQDQRLLAAMRLVPRHEFISADLRHLAYRDSPLPIGEHQTISQPYIVALMTELLGLQGEERVLEIGTGSGYQTALLCLLARHVYSLERYPRLAERAAEVINRLGYNNVDIHVGDGSQGLPDMAPFDAILVTAAAPAIPGPLRSQMSSKGGRLVIPIGDEYHQHLETVLRYGDRWEIQQSVAVKFVPLMGRYGFKEEDLPPDNSASV